MPFTKYICPDGETISCGACWEKCRMGQRCATLRYLKAINEGERDWTGKPSITQLLVGAREAMLKIKHDYAEAPARRAYAILGTRAHDKLDDNLQRLEYEGITGLPDCYEQDGKEWVLTDNKTYGSYKVAKLLGLVRREVPDPNGGTYSRGPRKGQPRTIPMFDRDPSAVDDREVTWQVNGYRLLLEKNGCPVDRLQVQAVVRDGDTRVARDRGIDGTLYLVPVRKLPLDEVESYFIERKNRLLAAVDSGTAPICSEEECWGGRKCERYCPVLEQCKAMGGPYGQG